MKAKLTIDLSAIKHNYNYLQTLTKATVAAAIKADAYGLGAYQIAPALWDCGCRNFFVAHLEEAIDLRKYLPSDSTNIYVLNGPTEDHIKQLKEYNLIPCLNNLSQVSIWNNTNPKGKCIIHIDTGMNRFGISGEDFESLKTLPEATEYLISHIACDGDPTNPYNKYQLDEFIKYTSHYKIKKSLVASNGIFLGTEYHFDMVRPGAALYGIGSSKNPNIKNPITLTSNIIHLNKCKENAYIGYGSTAHATAGSVLATIPVGYGDGFFRSLGNRGFVFINGKKAPIVGVVSMDLTVIDVTNIDCNIGNEVEIIGPNNTPDEIAHIIGTIGYEILTSLKWGRYNRVYTNAKSIPK
jgi:alanine racemase